MTDLTRGIYRRIYSGFIEGQRINKLSIQAEAWFWRVLAASDKQGRLPADVWALTKLTVGNRALVGAKKVSRWLSEMVAVGLVQRVEDYLILVDFERLQPKTVLAGERPAIPAPIRRDVLAAGYCAHCGRCDQLSVDHIQPVSKGGSDARQNLQCLCLPCNIQKSDKWEVAQ